MNIDVNNSVLEEMVRRLVRELDPDMVVLFGSRARGNARPDSDVDLLIVKDLVEPRTAALRRAYQALSGVGIPKDLLWYTPHEIAEWRDVSNFIATRALREGRVLYEKTH
jgi:predicted nucleotidyltransferase